MSEGYVEMCYFSMWMNSMSKFISKLKFFLKESYKALYDWSSHSTFLFTTLKVIASASIVSHLATAL